MIGNDAGCRRLTMRFYEELNDFLERERRKVAFDHLLNAPASIKDIIESLGIPHTEVDLILVNGTSVDFNYQPGDGDTISVYPVFESLDISDVTHLRPEPLRVSRFVADTHLGRLASYLRMLGFDTLYSNDTADAELADISAQQARILLTRDKKLLMRKLVIRGLFVHATRPRLQLQEVVERLDLFSAFKPFTRCMRCNGSILPVDKTSVITHLPARTRRDFDAFWQCSDCRKIYWKGSHYDRMRELIHAITSSRT